AQAAALRRAWRRGGNRRVHGLASLAVHVDGDAWIKGHAASCNLRPTRRDVVGLGPARPPTGCAPVTTARAGAGCAGTRGALDAGPGPADPLQLPRPSRPQHLPDLSQPLVSHVGAGVL